MIKKQNDNENQLSTVKPSLTGWICPVCGRGNSPYTNTCMCIPLPAVQWQCDIANNNKFTMTCNTGGQDAFNADIGRRILMESEKILKTPEYKMPPQPPTGIIM
jgi:hypothetical protein